MVEPDEPATPVALRPATVVARSLSDLAQLAGPIHLGARPTVSGNASVTGITGSSAMVRPGDLFAALPGSQTHGATHWAAAIAAGATAIFTDGEGAAILDAAGLGAVPRIVSPDARESLGAVAAGIYGDPSRKARVLGVTGTSGKTTTTFLLRAGLAAAGVSTGLVGTVGVFLGEQSVKTPFTTPEAPELQALLALMVERGIETIAMEVSSHALTLGRVNGVQFEVGAFTNLSQDHLDFHADMDEYFAAKHRLFDGRSRHEIVVIDDDWGRQMFAYAGPHSAQSVSTDGSAATWRADDIIVLGDGSTRFTVYGPDGPFDAFCRIPGRYNVANTVLALAILAQCGVDPRAVAPAVGVAQVRGRMERVDAGQPFLAVVDYSHKPAGVAGALAALRPLTRGRLIVVLGCGGDRDKGKRPVMGEVAARGSDVLIVTDDNPRTEDPAAIRQAMLDGARSVAPGESAQIIEQGDRHAAIADAIAQARPGDTVLVAGKGHETGQEVGASVLPFDDVTVVRDCLLAQGFSASAAGAGA